LPDSCLKIAMSFLIKHLIIENFFVKNLNEGSSSLDLFTIDSERMTVVSSISDYFSVSLILRTSSILKIEFS